MTEKIAWTWKSISGVLWKAALLFAVIVTALIMANPVRMLSHISVYNHLLPGRERLPYGDTPSKSYNLTIGNLETMLASHAIGKGMKPADEFRVILIGDSSVWGFLLKPEETLAGQLNQMGLKTAEGKRVVTYNLGYPTLSIIKDYLILEKALGYEPDLILWPVTLESLSKKNTLESPMIQASDLDRLSRELGIPLENGKTEPTILDDRRAVADWYRLQLYGFMWAATGIDQDYPADVTPAQRDLEADNTFEGCAPEEQTCPTFLYEVVTEGIRRMGAVPVWVINEPMLVSSGANSDIRYNFYYPRWVYDAYRTDMTHLAESNGWTYLDLWDLIPETEFTNSAIHLTPSGEHTLAESIASSIEKEYRP
jgi:hypothetical protein